MKIKEMEERNTQGILKFLLEEGYATAEQIKKAVFSHITDKSLTHRKKLLKMENKGLIGKKKVYWSDFSVYYLTKAGYDLIKDEKAAKITYLPERKISPTNPSGLHRLKCIDARLDLEKILPITEYQSERELQINCPFIRRPDFVFTCFGKRIAAEVELSYRNTRKYREIFITWCYELQRGKIDKILFLADEEIRKKHLQEKFKEIITQQRRNNTMAKIRIKTGIEGEQRTEPVWINEEDIKNFGFFKIGEKDGIIEFLQR